MKFLTVLLLSSLCLVGAGFAADDGKVASAGTTHTQVSTTRNYPDGFFMLNGKVVAIRDGSLKEVNSEITFKNGSHMMADGTLVRADGSRTTIGSQFVTADGDMKVQSTRDTVREVSNDHPTVVYTQVAVPQSSCCKSHHWVELSEDEKYENHQ